MANWPLPTGSPLGEVASVTNSWPNLTVVTASATPHTKGAWAQHFAATAVAWEGFWLHWTATFVNATDSSALLDIGFGAGGSEIVVVPDLPVGFCQYDAGSNRFYVFVPIKVPAGTRIALRQQSAIASKTTSFGILGQYGLPLNGGQTPGSCQAYGITPASSQGTQITSTTTANTYGAWGVLDASTAKRINAALVRFQGAGTTNANGKQMQVQIGVGGAGAEAPVGPIMYLNFTTSESCQPYSAVGQMFPIFGLNIPPGSRLVARCASNGSVATTIDAAVLGFPY